MADNTKIDPPVQLRNSTDSQQKTPAQIEPLHMDTPGRKLLRTWLNKLFRVKMTDGRILIGYFLCTDCDGNLILGMSAEFREGMTQERNLGLIIVAKKHIVSLEVDNTGGNIM